MRPVAILTPDPAYAAADPLWQTVLARLQRALQAAGIDSAATPWTAHADDAAALRGHACVLPLLAWGYHRDGARWQRACAAWQQAGVPLANPAPVLAWNSGLDGRGASGASAVSAAKSLVNTKVPA